MKVVAIIQARMGSTRLPGKVMMEVVPQKTVLGLTIERVLACENIDEVVVAIPESDENNPVADEAKRNLASVFRGSEYDTLARYIGAALTFEADIVIRVTSDCPLSDVDVISLHVERMKQRFREVDFVTNMMQPTFPLGVSVEAMPTDTLLRMERLSTTPYLREHVTTLAYEHPEWFVVDNIIDDMNRSFMRWTVDYELDLHFVQAIFQALYKKGTIFSMADVLELLNEHPKISEINATVGE